MGSEGGERPLWALVTGGWRVDADGALAVGSRYGLGSRGRGRCQDRFHGADGKAVGTLEGRASKVVSLALKALRMRFLSIIFCMKTFK